MIRIVAMAALLAAAFPLPGEASAAQRRLPPGWTWGRCLLEVDGRTYLSGRCSYKLERSGSFEMHGPRQIWDGIDYPRARYGAEMLSADWWATVDVQGGTGIGYWNRNIRASHAHSELGTLSRRGACWIGARARVCLWRR